MHREEGTRLSVTGRAAATSRTATPAGRSALGFKRHHYLLEVQWQGKNGRFRHVVVGLPSLLRAAGISALVALIAVAGALSLGSTRAPRPLGAEAVLLEHAQLAARQEALLGVAVDLAEQLYGRIEQGRSVARLAGLPGHLWEEECPRPPPRDAGANAIFTWLSEQGARLETLGNESAAGRLEIDRQRTSAPTLAPEGARPTPPELASRIADTASASDLQTPASP